MRQYRLPGRVLTRGSGAHLAQVAAEIAGLIVAAVFLGYVMQRLHHANLSVLFLLVVLIIATRHGLWPSVVTSLLGFLAFNFFFTVPYGTFRVTEEGDIATLVFFLAIAILGGNLASRLRAALRRRDQALERISNLYDFSHGVSGAASARAILQTLADHLAATLDAGIAVLELHPETESTLLAASRSPHDVTARTLHRLRCSGGCPAAEARDAGWALLPASLVQGVQTQLAIGRTDLTGEQRELVRNLCGQAEVALDRIRLAEDLDSSRREAERARLRSALLTSVSHDLRTPLASIVGAASTVQELGDTLAAADRADLLETVMGEARRLNGYIQNLLDMTRLEHGELRIQRDWEEPSDLIGAAVHRATEVWPGVRIETRVAPDVSLVHVHGELCVQALHNVIDNAARYSPPGAPLQVDCAREGRALVIRVTDAGRGIEEGERERIFDMFYRTESGDSYSGGTGLGLAITRGIIEAHGGQAYAAPNPAGPGTQIVLRIPDAMAESESGSGGP